MGQWGHGAELCPHTPWGPPYAPPSRCHSQRHRIRPHLPGIGVGPAALWGRPLPGPPYKSPPPSIQLSTRPSISVHPSIHPSFAVSLHPSILPSLRPSISVSLYPSILLSLCPSIPSLSPPLRSGAVLSPLLPSPGQRGKSRSQTRFRFGMVLRAEPGAALSDPCGSHSGYSVVLR